MHPSPGRPTAPVLTNVITCSNSATKKSLEGKAGPALFFYSNFSLCSSPCVHNALCMTQLEGLLYFILSLALEDGGNFMGLHLVFPTVTALG